MELQPPVQESDGNFFENFTALAWKQENRRRRTASEELKESEKPPPSECNFVPRAKQNPLMKKDFELLYIEVLYTIKHKIGTTTGSHLPFIQDLYLYAREAFGVTPEDHARLLAKASEEKPPVIVLNIAVVEGRNLEAKDADGFSDPYCMLGIMPGSRIPPRERQDSTGCSSDDDQPPRSPRQPHRRTNSALKRFSQSFKRKPKERDPSVRGQLPARFIRCTSVKPNTLNPQWNEEFRCDIEDVKTDRLHLDIWDHDDESSVFDAAKKLNEIAGLKGLGRFFKQVAQSARTSSKGNVDDFLGCVNLRFDDIPSTGTDRWYDLEGRSARSNVEGQIRLKCSLSTREARGIQDEDNWTDIRQHEDLMCLFIEHEIRKYKDDVFKWRGDLPRAALTILHQHAIQGDITDMQAAMCRWQAYSKKHREHAFDWEFLYKLLTDLDELWAPDSLTGDEEENLGESLSSFILHCVSLLQRQRELYPTGNKAAQYRLNHLLKCLAVINESIIYKRCCPFHAGIINDVSNVIKKSTVDWYGKLRGYSKTQSTPNEGMKIIQRLRQYISQNDEMTISAMIDLTNILNTDMQKATEIYDLMYENTLNIQYFNIVYKQTEQLLANDMSQLVEEELGEDVNSNLDRLNIADMLNTTPDDNDTNSTVNQQTAMQLFELYLALLEFCRFRKQLPANERRTLSVMKYYEWFNIPTKRWLDMAKSKVMKRIKTAVDLDKELAQVDSGIASKVKQSTSAIDVCCCFGQVVEFWKHLEWPDQAGSYSFVVKITEDLCEGAIYYADLIHAKLKQAGYYDDVGVFDVTEQLCMTINDIEQVKKALIPLSETLKYTELIQAIDKCNGERAAKESKYALVSILKSADDDLNKKINQVIGRVADRMKPFIRKDVFHLCWAPESVPTDKAISQLLNYLDSNLITLNTHLLQANFDRILEAIWLEVVDEIDAVIDNEETKPMSFYERLYHALDILVDFFHANDKGLKMEIIRCRPYAELYMLLSLNKAPTPELIQTYYLEKMEEQDSASSHEFGMISMRVYYNTDAEILSVEVLNAKNVIPLDPNGLSDPFVLIELCPQHLFPNQTIQQTKIIKNSLNPVFDETFDFSVSLEQCMMEGACILFTVMDHDFMLANDFAGEVYLSLNTITGVNGEHVAGFSALAPACLALTQPLSSSGPGSRARGALAALESRTWDRTAVEFAKKRRQIEQQCKT